MKITQDVRDYAATLNDRTRQGVSSRSRGEGGNGADVGEVQGRWASEVYVDAETVKESNKAL